MSGLTNLLPNVSLDLIVSTVAGPAGEIFQFLSPEGGTEALNVIVNAINKVYIVTLAAASVGFVCSLLLK
jgi:hypothetical protein